MAARQIDARHYATLKPVRISIQDEVISALESLEVSEAEAAQLPIAAPGFFDIQVNGYGGTWFSSPELATSDVLNITQSLVDRGIARYFPTLITASYDALHHGFATLRTACDEDDLVNTCVAGYHLEGPYISSEDGPRGAHPLQHVRAADYDEFSRLQEASGNRIRLITLAPEVDNAIPFIQQCRRDGVTVAIGHTAANTEDILAAVEAGAQLSTHLGNGAHGTLRRHPNYIWDQLADDHLWASVIADGWHLPASVLKCVLACKTAERMILTCDASGFAGCPPATYQEGDFAVDVLDDGRIVVAGQRQFLAGSGATTGDCVVRMSELCDLPLATTVQMSTLNPARLTGIADYDLVVGDPATLTVFRVESEVDCQPHRFVPVETIVGGRVLSRLLSH